MYECAHCKCVFDPAKNTRLIDDPAHKGERIEVVICPECHAQTTV